MGQAQTSSSLDASHNVLYQVWVADTNIKYDSDTEAFMQVEKV